MKRFFALTATVAAMAFAVMAVVLFNTDAALAATYFDHGLTAGGFSLANFALIAARNERERLQTRAEEIESTVRDDLDDEALRALDAEHEEITRGLADADRTIARLEAEEAGAGNSGDGNDGSENRSDPGAASLTAAEAADISRMGRMAGMNAEDVETAIRSNVSVADFQRRAFDHMATRTRGNATEPNRVTRDEAETRRDGMLLAMTRGFGGGDLEGRDAEIARPFMRHERLVDMAAEFVGHRGNLVSVRDREDVMSRAFHTTSDFPAIFSAAINTMLEQRYALREPTYRRISRRRDFMDFRPHYAVGIGEFPMLERLTEGGEIKFGTFGESKEQIAVVPYAKGIRISRQALVNDRLGAIGEVMGGYGRTVSRFEEITFYAMMLSANTKLADGKVVFHADHGNLAGAGAAISVASIGTAKAAMRKQKGLDDATLNITPSILLVSPDKETEALQYLAPVLASESIKVNPHVGTLDPVVAGELTGNAWYMFADPEEAPVYQWGLLDGYQAPRVRFDEPFGTQGVGMTVEHDFGVGAVDYRGGYKNPGA